VSILKPFFSFQNLHMGDGVRVMVFKATFNNILSYIWQSVLLVEETGENHQPVASY
jgi:hypothetical protein